MDSGGREHSEFGRKVTWEVNGGTEWTFDYGIGACGPVGSGVPVLGELGRVGLKDGEATAVTSSGHDRAEMIEVTDGRMESQGGSVGCDV